MLPFESDENVGLLNPTGSLLWSNGKDYFFRAFILHMNKQNAKRIGFK